MKKTDDIKTIHVIYFDFDGNNIYNYNENSTENTLIKIGRNKNCDIIIKDISVSRFHSEILFTNNGFSIRDYNSKFGTLVLMKRDIELFDKRLSLQIGRTLINFEPGNYKEIE